MQSKKDFENYSNQSKNKKENLELSVLDLEDEKNTRNLIETYFCAICLSPPPETIVCPCGHLFCKSCITRWIHTTNDAYCPKCRSHFDVKGMLKLQNGQFIRFNQNNNSEKLKILKPGFSAQCMKHSNLVIYQNDNQKPAFKSILITTLLFCIGSKIINYLLLFI